MFFFLGWPQTTVPETLSRSQLFLNNIFLFPSEKNREDEEKKKSFFPLILQGINTNIRRYGKNTKNIGGDTKGEEK